MKQFTYTITDPIGLHARLAGLLVKAAKGLDSTVTVAASDGRSAEATRLIALMIMGVKSGETVSVTIEGGDEENAFRVMEQFFRENL